MKSSDRSIRLNPLASRLLVLGAAVAAFGPTDGAAQDLPTLAPEDYGRWESLGTPRIDPFGRFVAHTVTRQDEASELRVIGMDRDTTWVVAWGEDPVFSPDGEWLAWTVGGSPDETAQLEEAGEPVRTTGWLLELSGSEPRDLGTARELSFDPTGRFLAALAFAPEEPDGAGADLRILDLEQGTEVGFSNIDEFTWADDRPLLAMVLATGTDTGNGVQLYNGRDGSVRGLEASGSSYSGATWREGSSDLAVLRTSGEEDDIRADVIVWREADGSRTRLELSGQSSSIADSLEVVSHRDPVWSKDGSRVSVGLRPRPTEEPEDTTSTEGEGDEGSEDDDPSTVQVWHSGDVEIIAQQKARSSFNERSTLIASWEPESDRVVQVSEDLSARAFVSGVRGFEHRTDSYAWGTKFGRPYHDVWAVDLDAGTRTRALEASRYDWVSPNGESAVRFDGEHYHALDLDSGTTTNITEGISSVFANTEWDTPTDDFLPPHGFGGWIEDDDAVLLYDRFDVWRVTLDGSSADRLTRGAEDEVVHRMLNIFPDEDGYRSSEAYFTLRGEWTEDRGFARWSQRAGYERLVLEAKNFRAVTKADSADVLVYRRESRTDSPDIFVSDLEFGDAKLVTESNPFMSEYAWTRLEFVDYQTPESERLHGVLLYPANHDASRRYPMIVYAYELLTPQTYFWEGPSERDYYNYTTWTQQGYFVLLPDIVFRARDPGVSTAETMEAAIGAVDAKGLIDRDRVGFIGHSWGGYEATYLAARTELFATTVAGAPLTDFVSFMGAIHWNPGVTETSHWENGQARMAVPYWEDRAAHERNSPIHGVETMTTPLLMAHGDADGVVEFFQATEFYNFARRAEKEMVLLVYEGEDHGFRQKANQIDYHRRILEWFGHYLKNEPAAAWITDGVKWSEHEKERGRIAAGSEPHR